jgi:microcompartment protein CcmL/EutN
MSSGKAMGFIESVGLVSAITAADAALKAANVELVGRENSRGSGFITIKIVGEVGAVNAAVSAAKSVSSSVARVWSVDVIPRPVEGLGKALVWNPETRGADEWLASKSENTQQPAPVKKDGVLANLPAREMVVVKEDIPKPAIPQPPKAETIASPPPRKAENGDAKAPTPPKKTPSRRKPGGGGRGKKTK